MRRAISVVLAGAIVGTSALASFVPAQALPQAAPIQAESSVIQVERDAQWYVRRGWRGNGWDGGWGEHNNGWRPGQGGWDNGGWNGNHHYYRPYRDRDDDNGAALALGLFGFAAGAMLGSQLYGGPGTYGRQGYHGVYDAHDAACARRFRSYDPYSNTYLGYDGDRHYC